MSRPSRFEAWYGRDEPPERVVRASLGDLALSVHGIDVRRMRHGALAIVDRIYVAVRDPAWGTIPGVISDVEVGEDPDTPFRMTFSVRHEADDIRFGWAGLIALRADGELTYRMDGVAGSDFAYSRLGICVLQPAAVTAGRPWTAITARGPETGAFPELVGPQTLTHGALHAITPPFSGIDIDLEGARLSLRLEGDLFETEDQRNWTDDSFKTYSTPISLGIPHHARQGQVFHQQVVVRVTPSGSGRASRRRVEPVGPDTPVELAPDGSPDGSPAAWPAIGLGGRSGGPALRSRELGLLRMLRPDHLRADIRPGRGRWRTDLARAAGDARALGCALELALTLHGPADPGLPALAHALGDTAIARVLVVDDTADPQGSTADGLVPAVRAGLLAASDPSTASAFETARWFGGTDGPFSELNRDRPSLDGLDGLSWSMHPQVHASDELSMSETLSAQATTVATARTFADGRMLAISPVTLQPRAHEPPDPRQATLFGAAWTVGSIAALVASDAGSVTWFGMVGPFGLLDRADRPTTSAWPAWASGAVFPMWHVFADLGDRRDTVPVPVVSPNRDVAALGIRFPDRLRLLVANLRPDPVECRLVMGDAPWARVRVLDHGTVDGAMRDPEAFRARTAPVPVGGGRVALRLGAFATAMVEAGTR